ncbi:hypothetical protein [Streptomyces niveus]
MRTSDSNAGIYRRRAVAIRWIPVVLLGVIVLLAGFRIGERGHSGGSSSITLVGVSQSSLAEPPADYIPVTDTVRGRVGDTVVVRLGVANLGPDTPKSFGGTFAVVPPAGTTITSIPWEGDDDDRRYSCRPPQDKDNYFFLCDLSEWGVPTPSSSPVTIGFHIRIDKRIPGAKGSITAYAPNDPVPGNDRAAIPVEAAPAPLWRCQHPLWRWQHWALTAGVLALVAPAGKWFVRRRRENRHY